MLMSKLTLILACGALAKEHVELQRLNQWEYMRLQCLPVELHNTPDKILRLISRAGDDEKLLSGRPLTTQPHLFIGAIENPFAPPFNFRPLGLQKK